MLLNSDVWCDIDLSRLVQTKLQQSTLAHLVLVENPEHNPAGDFTLKSSGLVGTLTKREDSAIDTVDGTDGVESVASEQSSHQCLTFSGVSVIHPKLVAHYADYRDVFPLRDLLLAAINDSAVSAEHYRGYWSDIGTPERLELLRNRFATAD